MNNLKNRINFIKKQNIKDKSLKLRKSLKKITKQIISNSIIEMPEQEQEGNNSCSMVGLLGILIQVGLGALSFSVLILKRKFEHPKRPWKIWTFDASKQMISQLIAHFINLTISLALTYDKQNSDECLWYFVTNVFDNTVGVFICILILKLVEGNLRKKRKFQLISGNYYRKIDPLSLTHEGKVKKEENFKKSQQLPHLSTTHPKSEQKQQNDDRRKSLIEDGDSKIQAFRPFNIDLSSQSQKQKSSQQTPEQSEVGDNFIYIVDYKAWIIQLCIWNGIVIIGKCVLFGLEFGLEKQLQEFSMYVLGWIQEYPVLELLVVIVIVPVIMNGLAYWVQDNFLMKSQKFAQQKNLIEQNLRQNAVTHNINDQIHSHDFNQFEQQKKSQQAKSSQSNRSRRESDFSANGGRFQFHDDYDAKDDQNPAEKFDNIFEKFGKFAT